jgi:hypothetical protein
MMSAALPQERTGAGAARSLLGSSDDPNRKPLGIPGERARGIILVSGSRAEVAPRIRADTSRSIGPARDGLRVECARRARGAGRVKWLPIAA